MASSLGHPSEEKLGFISQAVIGISGINKAALPDSYIYNLKKSVRIQNR